MSAVFGITGWKNSGKTTLVSLLVREFRGRGFTVSTIKHAHDSFDIDHPGTDSYSHREAGAGEVALVSRRRWALMHEISGEDEKPEVDDMLAKLGPCDLVLVEGFKKSALPKIECIRDGAKAPVWKDNDSIVAVACTDPAESYDGPQLPLDDVSVIADFIAEFTGLKR